MSVYRRNITDVRYDKRIVDVLVPYSIDDSRDTTNHHDAGKDFSCTDQRKILLVLEEDGNDGKMPEEAAWDLFEKYLNRSEPLKIMHWTKLRRKGGVDRSCLGRLGDLVGSYNNLVSTMPREALDAIITVQAKMIRNLPPCRLCRNDYAHDVSNEENAPTDDEFVRHNLHVVHNMLTMTSYNAGDEQTIFLGQEDQVTATKKLGEVLIERESHATRAIRVCVAQVNIYSQEESNTTATVNKTGRIVIEGSGDNGTRNPAPLAALLPWIRVPSFLLPTIDDQAGGGRVKIQEINFWMCPKECQTNTHYDGHHNLLMVLHGSKTVELSPPGAVRGSPVHSNHANHPFLLRCTQVGGSLIHPDFDYDTCPFGPSGSKEDNIVLSVAAGEAVFIPEGWWHRVESSDNCVAINVWFDHGSSSLSSLVCDDNRHQLPYQAREMVRRYIDENIEDLNSTRRRLLCVQLLEQLGVGSIGRSGWDHDWTRDPGKPIRQLVDTMRIGRLEHERGDSERQRTNEEILNGMALIEQFASQLLGVSGGGEYNCLAASDTVRPLRLLALPLAIEYLGNMISLFIAILDPEKQRDRIAMMSLFDRFPQVTTLHQRRIFTTLVKSIARGACYILSIAWEKHGHVSEAEASYNSFFGRCIGEEGRQYFTKEVDDFRNESARRLILGDLMLLNPSHSGGD